MPNWTVRRRSNRARAYRLDVCSPITAILAARIEPLRYLAHVADYYGHAMGADPGFAGVLAHNPAARYRQDQFRTTWGRRAPYTLDDLASVIPFRWEPPAVRQTGIGRNCDLFHDLMIWAGRRENAAISVLSAAPVRNQQFDHPLAESEVAATARSVERYRARWAARGWHSARWIARQKARASRGGKAKAQAHQGNSIESRKPWDDLGISRSTWYRRKAARKMRLLPYTDRRAEPDPQTEGGRA